MGRENIGYVLGKYLIFCKGNCGRLLTKGEVLPQLFNYTYTPEHENSGYCENCFAINEIIKQIKEYLGKHKNLRKTKIISLKRIAKRNRA